MFRKKLYDAKELLISGAQKLGICEVPQDVRLEIDRTTVLKDLTLTDLISGTASGQSVVVPQIDVHVNEHELSVQSNIAAEKSIYRNHLFHSPELLLERLSNQYWFPEYGFLLSTDGKVWRHSVLGQYGDPNFLTTYAVEDRKKSDGSSDYIFHEHLLHDAPILEGPFLITSHYGSHNYGHFLLDMVPLIQLGKQLGLKMISRPLIEWQPPIYNRVGVDLEEVTIISDKVVLLKDVYVSNRHNAVSTYAASPNHRDVFDEIRRNIPDSSNKNAYHPRIYLSRGGSKNREIRNREALEEMLRSKGFAIIRPAQMTFDEQAILFSQADIVVSEFGAIMSNVVFCRKGTKVIEIIPENQVDPWSAHLCAALNLEHVTLFHPVNDEDRDVVEIAGRVHRDINFKFDADIDLIQRVISKI